MFPFPQVHYGQYGPRRTSSGWSHTEVPAIRTGKNGGQQLQVAFCYFGLSKRHLPDWTNSLAMQLAGCWLKQKTHKTPGHILTAWPGLWGGIRILFGEELLTGRHLKRFWRVSSIQKVWLHAYVARVCIRAGLHTTYATTILTYARGGVWDSLTRLFLQGIAYAATSHILTKMLTHGLTPCICHQDSYSSLRNPGFCIHKAAILQGFGPCSLAI